MFCAFSSEINFSENHDLQVRFRWRENDVAIWDKYVQTHAAPGEPNF
jgi:alpha-ketoglutarate-dependent taurine dioxygenase